MKKGLVFCLIIVAVLGSFPTNLSAQDKFRLENLSKSLAYLSRVRILANVASQCCEQQKYLTAVDYLNQASKLTEAAESSLAIEIMSPYKRAATQEDIKSLKNMIDDMKKNTAKMILLERLIENLEKKNKKVPDKSL